MSVDRKRVALPPELLDVRTRESTLVDDHEQPAVGDVVVCRGEGLQKNDENDEVGGAGEGRRAT